MLESILESSINSKITEIDVSLRGYLSSLQGELESDGEVVFFIFIIIINIEYECFYKWILY